MTEQVPQKLGKYEIIEEIGRGGFGTVYKAIDTTSGQAVALKVLDPLLLREPGAIERMQREANIAQRLDHPNIVKVLEVGEVDGTHYIAMEYLEGQSLKALIQKEGTLPTNRLLRIVEQVADALDYVHALGLLHRDVKPSNIIVGEDDKATLTDFGLAMVSGLSGFTTGKALLGTLPYMSPEQVAGEESDHRSDIYSLAVTAYEMCTGRLPFSGDNPAAIIKGITLDEPPPPSRFNSKVCAGIDHVILKSLAKDKSERHQSASAFARNLQEASRPGYVVKPVRKPKPPKKGVEREEREEPRSQGLGCSIGTVAGVLILCIASALVGVLSWRYLLPLIYEPAVTPEVIGTVRMMPSETATTTSTWTATRISTNAPPHTPTLIPSATLRPSSTPTAQSIPCPTAERSGVQPPTMGPYGDHDDDPSIATRIDYGQVIQGVITDEADLDYYSFAGSANDWISVDIDAQQAGSPLDSAVTLFDSAGDRILRNDDTDGQDPRFRLILPSTEIYYVLVEEYGNNRGGPDYSYTLRLTVIPGDNNDSLATASPLSYGQRIDGVITLEGDLDYYVFDAAPGDLIDIDIEARGTGSPLDSELLLFDSQGTRLARNDDYDDVDPYIRFRLTASGNHYILVQDYGNNGGGDDYSYALEVHLAPPDGNDSISQATPIQYGDAIDGVIDFHDDLDYYRFVGSQGDVINVSTDAYRSGSPLDSLLTLLDEDGQEIASNDDSFSGRDSFIEFTIPGAGIYYVLVEEEGRNAGGREYFYLLRLTSFPGQ